MGSVARTFLHRRQIHRIIPSSSSASCEQASIKYQRVATPSLCGTHTRRRHLSFHRVARHHTARAQPKQTNLCLYSASSYIQTRPALSLSHSLSQPLSLMPRFLPFDAVSLPTHGRSTAFLWSTTTSLLRMPPSYSSSPSIKINSNIHTIKYHIFIIVEQPQRIARIESTW